MHRVLSWSKVRAQDSGVDKSGFEENEIENRFAVNGLRFIVQGVGFGVRGLGLRVLG